MTHPAALLQWMEFAGFLLALGGAGLLGWLLQARRQPAALPAAHHRLLGQAMAETQSIGLALRRLASAPAMDRDEAQALALQLLDVTDHLGDLLVPPGPRRLQEGVVALGPLVADAAMMATAQLGGTSRPCRIDASLAGVQLRADARALRGAVVQVLVRAARLSRPQDVIEIRFARLGSLAAIIIEDEGAGLAADDLAAPGPAGHTRGLGFGLSLARSLLHAHGGDLVFETACAIGTRAWLTLPESRLLPEAQPAQA